jgi:hypothetical protein
MGHQHFIHGNQRHAYSLGRQKYLENKGYKFIYIKTTTWRYVLKSQSERMKFI